MDFVEWHGWAAVSVTIVSLLIGFIWRVSAWKKEQDACDLESKKKIAEIQNNCKHTNEILDNIKTETKKDISQTEKEIDIKIERIKNGIYADLEKLTQDLKTACEAFDAKNERIKEKIELLTTSQNSREINMHSKFAEMNTAIEVIKQKLEMIFDNMKNK